MIKKLAWLAAVAGAAWLLPAWALSLGGIQIYSRLNQPLSASIPINAAAGEVIDDSVKVRVASPEDYVRAGLDRADFLSDLKFEIRGGLVVVSSTHIAREPVTNLLLEVSWNGGRLLRQYTVLLDPDVPGAAPLAPAPPEITAQAGTGYEAYSHGNVGGTRPRRQMPAAESASPANAPATLEEAAPAVRTRMYGPVKANETAWSVASKLRPDKTVSVEQVIIALFQWNPTAFGSDLTTLRPGSRLRVPDVEVMRRVDPELARARVAEARSKPAETPQAPPAEVARPSAGHEAPTTAPAPKVQLQQPAKQAPTPAAEAPAEPAPTAPAAGSETQATPAAEQPAAAAPAAETPAAQPAPGEAAKPAAPPERQAKEKGAGTWLYPVLIILAALFLVWLVWRLARKPRSPAEGFEIEEPPARAGAARTVAAAAAAMPARAVLEPQAAFEPSPPVKEPSVAVVPPPAPPPPTPAPAPVAAAAPAAASLTDTRQIDLEGGDALAEADFHLAYGLYDEAILLLTQALTRDPGRTDIRVKLAEAYFSANRAPEFLETAKRLRGQLDAAGWEKIAVLGHQLFPSDPMFGGDGRAPAARVEPPAPAKPAAEADAGVIAFDLPEPAKPSAKPEAAVPAAAAKPEPFELEPLDLEAPAPASADDMLAGVDLESRLNLDDPALGGDEATTKLDLARAYIDLGDNEMARGLLGEVIQQGSGEQKQTAEELMRKLPA